ncbi:hypothetical protein GA0070624_4681 [Micromonospora rhizosphaerae]|uniref:Uncharacterized protein n=1 Tax=Micromonospora rhizosphaerae TaxID=568872 RepID=A0A1C6SV37_9ACTN|nr:hypothetical protein GA0070624_4681 [Micromonospora rhizosphaerae]
MSVTRGLMDRSIAAAQCRKSAGEPPIGPRGSAPVPAATSIAYGCLKAAPGVRP